jgi:ELWxxDGT repeat protein
MRKTLTLFSFLQLLFLSVTFGQTAISNFSYSSFTAGRFYVYNNKLFFMGRSAANTQEYFKLDLSNNNVTQLTNDHYRSSGGTIFRTLYNFGTNVFSGAAKPNAEQNIEFSRFDLTTETEQWVDLHPGYEPVYGNPYSSDPIYFSEDKSSGKVYFNPWIPASGNQIHYWDPSNNSIVQLGNVNAPTGISQNSSSGIVYIGDSLYTVATIGSNTSLLNMHKTNGGYKVVSNSAITSIKNLVAINNKVYFAARYNLAHPGDDYNLYVYNPANGITTRLTNYTTTEADGNLSGFNVGPDNTLYVNVSYYNTSPTQGDFFSVNTTNDVVTYRPGPSSIIRNIFFHATATHVYVQRINGTSREIHKINLSNNSSVQITIPAFTAMVIGTIGENGKMYFSGTESTYGSELYEFDFVHDMVFRLTDINSGTANSAPSTIMTHNGKIYFTAITAANGREIYAMNIPSYLPVKWKSVEAINQTEKTSLLTWAVDDEYNCKGYNLQVSTNGQDWKTVKFVAAKGGGKYTSTVEHEQFSIVYFRIAEISTDNVYSYSVVRSVRINHPVELLAYPNPSSNGKLQIKINGKAASGKLMIYTSQGSLVKAIDYKGGTGIVPVSGLKPGNYYARFFDYVASFIVK